VVERIRPQVAANDFARQWQDIRVIAEEWGRLNVPHPLPVIDGLLAATARVLGLTLATRNVDVEITGVESLDPFDPG
jgi:predicted nucleic acid-binding protein